MGHIHVLVGNYGSGKTELALNMAAQRSMQGKAVTLVDLDIVNPYFRSSEQRSFLEGLGVHLITPTFAETAVDIPALPAEVTSIFNKPEDIIIDVGGDDNGARALGRYAPWLNKADKTVYMVINIRRPFSETPDKLFHLQRAIESRARLKVDAYINNTNLSGQTTATDLLEGEAILEELCKLTGVKKRFLSGKESVIAGLHNPDAENIPITIYTRLDWME